MVVKYRITLYHDPYEAEIIIITMDNIKIKIIMSKQMKYHGRETRWECDRFRF